MGNQTDIGFFKTGSLLRFQTSKTETGKVKGLDAYIDAMPEGQPDIYYVAADTRAAAENSPFLEQLAKKGYEVLFMIDPIDEVAMANLTQYKEKKLVDISKEDLNLGETDEEEKKRQTEVEEEMKPLTDWLQETLGAGKVEKVAVSKRLTDTPCILVTSKFGWSANMERIMKAQAMGDNRAQEYMKGKKTMEINPKSPVILDLKAKLAAGETATCAATAELLFDAALLNSGFAIDEPAAFAAKIFDLMGQAVGGASGDASGDASSSGGFVPPEKPKEETKEEEAKPDAIDPEVV